MAKQIQIGSWDSAGQVLDVDDTCTLGQALTMAGISLQASERIASMNTNRMMSMNDIVDGGDQYVITQNHTSG
jgi:hypothetical protein